MITNSYYGPEGHGPYEMIDIGTLELEEGGAIPNCRLAVQVLDLSWPSP